MSATVKTLYENSLQRQIVGTWRLVLAQDRKTPQDKWTDTFGNPPSGYFMYDVTGYASIQIMTTPPVKFASPGNPTPEEALEVFNGYIAYYGTYTVDEETHTIIHHVEGGLNPGDVGTDQPRPFELSGDRLIIGDQVTWIRVLERVR